MMNDTEFECLQKISDYLKMYNNSNGDLSATPCKILNSFTNSNAYTRSQSSDEFNGILKIINYFKNGKPCWSYGNNSDEKLNENYFLKTLNFIEREMMLYKLELLEKYND